MLVRVYTLQLKGWLDMCMVVVAEACLKHLQASNIRVGVNTLMVIHSVPQPKKTITHETAVACRLISCLPEASASQIYPVEIATAQKLRQSTLKHTAHLRHPE